MAHSDTQMSGFVQAINSIFTSQNDCAQHEQCDSSCPGRVDIKRYYVSSTGVRSNEVDLRAELARQNKNNRQPSSAATRTQPLSINPDTPRFRYIPLEQPGKRIRLLKIKPAIFRADPVDIELLETDLDKAPPYGALSYCWGKDPADNKILCNGSVFHATPSLEHSLKRLRAGFRAGEREDWIWADAICINQQDVEEKEAQVWMMHRIYSAASTVYADLGSLAGYSIPVGDGLVVRFEDSSSGLGAQDIFSQTDNPAHPLHFRTVLNALSRPWFTRTWIIQEIVLARRVKYIFHGNVFTQHELDAMLSKEAIRAHPERMQELMAAGTVISRANMNYHKMQSIKKAYHDGTKLSLEFVQLTRDFEATEPKDKIYGLIALFNDKDRKAIGPYSQSVQDVYRRFAALQVKLGHAIEMLNSAGLHKRNPPHGHDLPSWVPDWTAQHRSAKVISTLRPVPYSATKTHSPRIKLLGDAGSNGLRVRGLLIDRLISVTPFVDSDPDPSFFVFSQSHAREF